MSIAEEDESGQAIVNPYAAPSAVPDAALVGPPADYNLTYTQLLQTAVLSIAITVVTVLIFSIYGPEQSSNAFLPALSLSIGVPAVAVLLLAGYRGSGRADGERKRICAAYSAVALSAMGIIAAAVDRLSNMHFAMEIAVGIIIVSSTLALILFGVLSTHGVSFHINRIVLALVVCTAGFIGVFFGLIFAFETLALPDRFANVLMAVTWICTAIVQVPIATKVRS